MRGRLRLPIGTTFLTYAYQPEMCYTSKLGGNVGNASCFGLARQGERSEFQIKPSGALQMRFQSHERVSYMLAHAIFVGLLIDQLDRNCRSNWAATRPCKVDRNYRFCGALAHKGA